MGSRFIAVSTTQSALPGCAGSRLHEGTIRLALDFLGDSGDTVSLLSEEIDVVNQQVRLGHATILRVAQFGLLLAVWRTLLTNDVVKPRVALVAFKLQIVNQCSYLRAWFLDPARGTSTIHEGAAGDQHCGENLQSLSHVFLRPARKGACNIARRPQRFHRFGGSKRRTPFLHPYSVGTGISMVMLDRLFERGAVCVSA